MIRMTRRLNEERSDRDPRRVGAAAGDLLHLPSRQRPSRHACCRRRRAAPPPPAAPARRHTSPAALSRPSAALLGPPDDRRCDMSELGLDFELGEMADTIRDTTQRFAERPDRAAGREDRRGGLVPDRAVAGNGRARAARDHGERGGWRARARLSRACRGAGGGGAGLGLDRAELRRAFEPLREPDPALGEPGAEGEISAEADLAASMSAASPCRRPGRDRTWSR